MAFKTGNKTPSKKLPVVPKCRRLDLRFANQVEKDCRSYPSQAKEKRIKNKL